jgi:serine/threonine-protein kinase HipA
MVERLSVIYETRVVATLQRKNDGALELIYSELAREIAEGRVLLSASLPVRREPYNAAELMPFFEGLLPEELVRQRLAARLRIDAGDVFGFLREIGPTTVTGQSGVPAAVQSGVPASAASSALNWWAAWVS